MVLSNENELIIQAITCPDYAEIHKTKDHRSFATIGDSLLSFLFLDLIRRKNIATTMEELTNWKEIIQDNSIQNVIGKNLFESKINAENNDLLNKKVFATTLEAYTYANYQVYGLDECKRFVENEVFSSLGEKPIYDFIIDTFEKKSKEPSKGKNWGKLIEDFIRNIPTNQFCR